MPDSGHTPNQSADTIQTLTGESQSGDGTLISGKLIPAEWYARPSPAVAPELLGATLVRQFASGQCYRGRIVETEAYAPGDPACHAYKGATARNRAMFGPAGHLYIYLIYGMYHCLNVVTDGQGVGSAVLIRALELNRLPPWIADKKRKQPHRVAAGPGLLCRALQLDLQFNGSALRPRQSDAVWLEFPTITVPAVDIVQTTRIGLTQGTEIPWRWYIQSSVAVSKF